MQSINTKRALTESLRRLKYASNWKFTSSSRRDFLIRERAQELTPIADILAEAFQRGLNSSDRMGIAADRTMRRDQEMTLRIVQALHPLHSSRVDISLLRRGPDLFVRVALEGRSWHRYMNGILLALTVSCFVILFGFAYFHWTNAFSAIMDDSIRQSQPAAIEAPLAVRAGLGIDPVTQEWVSVEYPQVSVIARENPRQLWLHLATPVAVILGVSSAIAYFLRKSLEALTCFIVGWPSIAAFDDFGTANEAWAIGVLNGVLAGFGVSEIDKVTT